MLEDKNFEGSAGTGVLRDIPVRSASRFNKLWMWFLLGLVILSGTYFLYTNLSQPPEEHLIQGVPYWGMYRGVNYSTSGAFVTYSLLRYWGDDRFTTSDIGTLFPTNLGAPKEIKNTPALQRLVTFFTENGYQVSELQVQDVSELYQTINENNPVILLQKISPFSDSTPKLFRILIGYSEDKQELVFHDNIFGNNYIVSYDNFERMQEGKSILVRIVTPSEAIMAEIAGPDRSTPYPERLSIMDDQSMQRIQKTWVIIGHLRRADANDVSVHTSLKRIRLWEEILAEDAFEDLHPAARLLATFHLSKLYTNVTKDHEKALLTLTEITLPLLSIDFKKPFGEWERLNPEGYDNPWWKAKPRVLLGLVHSRLGNTTEAETFLKKALEIDPNDEEARDLLLAL